MSRPRSRIGAALLAPPCALPEATWSRISCTSTSGRASHTVAPIATIARSNRRQFPDDLYMRISNLQLQHPALGARPRQARAAQGADRGREEARPGRHGKGQGAIPGPLYRQRLPFSCRHCSCHPARAFLHGTITPTSIQGARNPAIPLWLPCPQPITRPPRPPPTLWRPNPWTHPRRHLPSPPSLSQDPRLGRLSDWYVSPSALLPLTPPPSPLFLEYSLILLCFFRPECHEGRGSRTRRARLGLGSAGTLLVC